MKKVIVAALVIALLLPTMVMASAYAAGPPDVEQHIFVHYARGSKPQPPATDTGYYKLLGAKWQTLPVTLEVNPTDPTDASLSAEFVLAAIGMAAEEWDDGEYSALSGNEWGGVTVNLFSDTISTTNKGYYDLAWNSDKRDYANTIVWDNYPTAGVIAVTIIWFNRATKAILEFDMVFDTDYTWGNAINGASVMDLQNIATHELGHGVGLNDLYQIGAYRETMYGYASEGDTNKRDLFIGDQTGITKLYG